MIPTLNNIIYTAVEHTFTKKVTIRSYQSLK